MLTLTILYALLLSPVNALSNESSVVLDREAAVNLIVDFKSCTYTKNKLASENEALSAIHTDEIEKILLLEEQYTICDENHIIKKVEAEEWKASYETRTEELIVCQDKVIDIPSVGIGSLIGSLLTLLLIL